MTNISQLGRFQDLLSEEYDSCGIVTTIEKDGVAKQQNMLDTIEALIKLEHRSGFINGEGDGCGILTDLPRKIWAKQLAANGCSAELAEDPHFVVAHLFLPKNLELGTEEVKSQIRSLFRAHRFQILAEKFDQVNSSVLGTIAQADEPHFWQVGLLPESFEQLTRRCFDWVIEAEKRFPIQVASFSEQTVIYKLMGAASLLPLYFVDLHDPDFQSLVTLGHNRYSTNTLSNFFRVQPFSLLGHNGEINTIRKLRDEALMIGVPLAEESSDSQDVNRLIETLIHKYQYSLFEAIEMVFPPIINEIKSLPKHLQNLYMYYRQIWGPFAQGPAGIISRYGDECAFRVDALGLRPLWQIESERAYYFSSEQGIIPGLDMVSEPKPLAPGETIGVQLTPTAKLIPHHQLQQLVWERTTSQMEISDFRDFITTPQGNGLASTCLSVTDQAYAAFGWEREHLQMVKQMADTGVDPIRSLGHDGPLAALAKVRQNLPDYIKESVAVVTNPAIDREREMEHFSTRVVIGQRPVLQSPTEQKATRIELPSPILLEGPHAAEVCNQCLTLSFDDLVQFFNQKNQVTKLSLTYSPATGIQQRLTELAEEAKSAVINGTTLLVFDDEECHQQNSLYLDPYLALSKVDLALKHTTQSEGQNLRRSVSIVLRSGAIRNLHDLAIAIGLGADAISPYLMFATIQEKEALSSVHLYQALYKGLEKIVSTLGIHELRGYSRLFSSIGLHSEIADLLQIVNYCGTDKAGLSWDQLEKDAEERMADFHSEQAKPARLFHLWPRIWKSIGQLAQGSISYEDFALKLHELERDSPISLRHLSDFRFSETNHIHPDDVDCSIGHHDLPFVISSMSFGSQNEVAFRAYAEAAERLNMVSLNGEGGEIKDMLGKYPHTRGHQIASGRFGVNIELANSANLLEIKIGQGAKPGEGGHLPGKKVSEKVAAARNATPGNDLISPSNNHDIYSIEDLAQIITELKTANPFAKVIVKVPVVPNIGTISVGIAKAGADIITLSGFDGGTGAARVHALQHVGLPVEIGVKAAHNALLEAGIRHQVEIWADGGLKSALDVIKIICLGANRVGFGTLAMLAIGCTTCRGCHLDTCHVGIATQVETVAEAEEHGFRRFVPRELDRSIEGLTQLFTTLSKEIQRITAQLGFTRTQDLVGRSDLLIQTREQERLDLSDLLQVSSIESSITPTMISAGLEENHLPHSHRNEAPTSYTGIHSAHRVLVSDLSSQRVRHRLDGSYRSLPPTSLEYLNGSIPGNGFAAFHADGIQVTVHGGAQDGVAKTAFGGKVAILKSPNKKLKWMNGSVGKGFCYGAQQGLFIVQGDADSRAGIRLSGADLIIAGELKEPLRDDLGMIANRANIKGFAFEYMTNGRAVVLGDPGPWICSGMTGGVVYLRLQPQLGLDQEAIQRRIAKAAKVALGPLYDQGVQDLQELLNAYLVELIASGQLSTAQQIQLLLENLSDHFVQIIPVQQQADPSISTE
ncbi:glutamate synthase-related protein [Hazenella coriacea]|uniref:Glutamate synthase (NADPH/NADH) large chain n=1 Tax=Hazenella coriacea TaxID=1179467 RepID=A0A4R3L1H8_9BACL|nr:glutamate synthase-related protein [Hazenella coriacea]TCS92825.1 glutamate synthase (NADPH/NADH) large chain [Hazenella coriacea]